jgi:hypothetical protein
MADAAAAHEAAAEVLIQFSSAVDNTHSRMSDALSPSLHEPARSILHGPHSPAEDDMQSLGGFSHLLQRRANHHRSQNEILTGHSRGDLPERGDP